MMKKNLVHNILFRIFSSIGFGFMAYVLILLVFDSLANLQNLFIGHELMVTILGTALVFESLRILTIFIGKASFSKKGDNPYTWILKHLAIGLPLTVMITLLVFGTYFKFYLGYSEFNRELWVFNIIFLLTAVFYLTFYFSLFFMHQRNEIAIEHEYNLHQNLEYEFRSFQRENRPELFYTLFESLLILIHSNQHLADRYIDCFSKVYRYIIESRKKELVPLHDEIDQITRLQYLLNFKYEDQLTILTDGANDYKDALLVPGSLQIVAEHIIFSTIISKRTPLKVQTSVQDNYLVLSYKMFDVIDKKLPENDLLKINEACFYFMKRKIEFHTNNDEKNIYLPLLSHLNVEELEE